MPNIKTEYTVFISSPGDLTEERQIVLDVVDEINVLRAHRSSAILKTLTWENDVVPNYGQKPQEIINSATIGQYDIFLGFMCARFGTATDNAGSGTEEEFQIAYDAKIKSPEKLEVLFYFKDARNSKSAIDGSQLAKVDRFKKSLQSDFNGIHGTFDSPDEFRTQIARHLTKILDEFEKNVDATNDLTETPSAIAPQLKQTRVIDPLEQLNSINTDIVEDGLIETAENLERASNKVVVSLKPVTELIMELNENTRNRTDELNQLNQSGAPQKSKQTKVINLLAAQMEKFVDESKNILPPLQLSLEEHIDSFRKFIIVFGGENLGSDNRMVEATVDMLDGIKTAAEAFDNLGQSATSIPRMTSRLNLTKRNVAAISEGISKMLNSAHKQLEELSRPLFIEQPIQRHLKQ